MLGIFMHDPADIRILNRSKFLCSLHYANATSPALTGDLGTPTYPMLASFVVDDVDNADEVYGEAGHVESCPPLSTAAAKFSSVQFRLSQQLGLPIRDDATIEAVGSSLIGSSSSTLRPRLGRVAVGPGSPVLGRPLTASIGSSASMAS